MESIFLHQLRSSLFPFQDPLHSVSFSVSFSSLLSSSSSPSPSPSPRHNHSSPTVIFHLMEKIKGLRPPSIHLQNCGLTVPLCEYLHRSVNWEEVQSLDLSSNPNLNSPPALLGLLSLSSLTSLVIDWPVMLPTVQTSDIPHEKLMVLAVALGKVALQHPRIDFSSVPLCDTLLDILSSPTLIDWSSVQSLTLCESSELKHLPLLLSYCQPKLKLRCPIWSLSPEEVVLVSRENKIKEKKDEEERERGKEEEETEEAKEKEWSLVVLVMNIRRQSPNIDLSGYTL